MKNDIGDVAPEGWAEVVGDLLHLASTDQRVAILELALEKERKEAAERAKAGGFVVHCLDEESWNKYLKSAAHRHWNNIMLIEAVAAYTFIRHVTNNNSPQDARKLLFRYHHEAPGSGYLDEYLEWQWVREEAHQRRDSTSKVVEKWKEYTTG
jgi:hypothetical protein